MKIQMLRDKQQLKYFQHNYFITETKFCTNFVQFLQFSDMIFEKKMDDMTDFGIENQVTVWCQ